MEEAPADEQANGTAEEQAQQEDEVEQEPESMCIRVVCPRAQSQKKPDIADTCDSYLVPRTQRHRLNS